MKNELYRKIPKVDILLENPIIIDLIEENSRELVVDSIRKEIKKLRKFIEDTDSVIEGEGQIKALIEHIMENLKEVQSYNMTPVINATGTILHTNLGRAPLGKKQLEHICEISGGYSNLEYNIEAGCRGARYDHFEKLLCELTGAEAAMAVNNNAAAVMLILNSLGREKEIIVSRGELVEVGGKFRIPDVMDLSRGKLVEVGTTNKTHFSDYEEAITDETAILMKVHTSNYRILGFTETVSIEELSKLGKERNIPVVEDLGSGVLLDLSKFGISYEPTVQDSIKAGADVVCFSGDKLLGGPQAGIIVGKKKYIEAMRKNQMTRALRIDKFTAAALEGVLTEYKSQENAIKNIPILQMISLTAQELKIRAINLVTALEKSINLSVKLIECKSQIGGGSMPLERLDSYGVSVKANHMSTSAFEKLLRGQEVPIIARIENDEVIFDVRTLNTCQMETLVKQLKEI